MRTGHDISIEVVLDAGVPLLGAIRKLMKSTCCNLTPAPVVRLKDQVTNPNKDFVLKLTLPAARSRMRFWRIGPALMASSL